jgi:hypothetical protein
MPNIVKIAHLQLFLGFGSEESVIDCYRMKKYMDDNGFKHDIRCFPHTENYKTELEIYSTWVFDLDYKTVEFKHAPLVMWQEVYDDYDVIQCVVQTIPELEASRLIPNKALIE